MSRSIQDLFIHQGTIYVYCSGAPVKALFARHLAEQGFRFGDGAALARRPIDSLMCVHRDHTISYCGFVCHLQCGSLEDPVYVPQDSFDGCTRVDYARFISGADDCVIRGKRPGVKTAATVEFW